MKKIFISLSNQPLVNVKKVHYITKEESLMVTPDGVHHYVYKIKFTFASNRVFIWYYKGDDAVAGAKAQDLRDFDYVRLENCLK